MTTPFASYVASDVSILANSHSHTWFITFVSFLCFQVEDEVGEIGMVIVQNKIDLIDDEVVQPFV